MTGGSQADARARTPPRFGGLALAGIQSGCGEAAAARRARSTVAAEIPAAERRTKSRRLRRACGPSIASSFTAHRIEGKDGSERRRVLGTVPDIRRQVKGPAWEYHPG